MRLVDNDKEEINQRVGRYGLPIVSSDLQDTKFNQTN